MKLKYEICKAIKDREGNMGWLTIAWSDVRTYASDILYALSVAFIDDKFAILDNGQVYKES